MLRHLNIVCGHYGSGKTVFAVNLALEAKRNEPERAVHAVDLDIVNPYFRTADDEKILRECGVEVHLPQYANSNVDIPVIPAGLTRLFESRNDFTVIDVGGDDGAAALGMYREAISGAGYSMFGVINMYRPLISEPEAAAADLREIEACCGLKCTALVNASSLGAETTADVIADSVEYAEATAGLMGLPLYRHLYCTDYAPDTPEIFAERGIKTVPLMPVINVTKKLF